MRQFRPSKFAACSALVCALLAACEDDAELPDPMDASASHDGATPDATGDAGAALDAAAPRCTFESSYDYVYGNLLGRVAHGRLSPPATYAQISWDGGVRCSTTLPACGSASIDPEDIAQALRAPVVATALASGMASYGRTQQFESDEVPFRVEKADGGAVVIGSACPTCDIPQGLLELKRLLLDLDKQQLDAGVCAPGAP